MVHKKEGLNTEDVPGDGYAVVAVFLNIGEDNSALKQIETSLKSIVEFNDVSIIPKLQPQNFLPVKIENFYQYEGSLTTPTCSEVVIWTIMKEPLSITAEQVSTSV